MLSVCHSWKSKLKQLIRDRGIITWLGAAICIVCSPSATLKYHSGVCVCLGGFACLCMMDDFLGAIRDSRAWQQTCAIKKTNNNFCLKEKFVEIRVRSETQ